MCINNQLSKSPCCLSPLISVIIPVFNDETYLYRAACSVLNQPNADKIELFLIDDGSTDKSKIICDELAREHSNTCVIHKENGGVSSARNLGIEKARGKYLAFLDSDDWWMPCFFTGDLIDELEKDSSADLYCFSYQKVSPMYRYKKVTKISNFSEVYSHPDLSHFIDQPFCAFLYLTDYIKTNSLWFPPVAIAEDTAFKKMCCTYAHSITCKDQIMFSYWMNDNSCIHKSNSIRKFRNAYAAEYYLKMFHLQNGIDYEIDRTVISLIAECLPAITVENSYRSVKKLLSEKEFTLLHNSNVQPWQRYQKDIALWRSSPLIAYVKSKIFTAPYITMKRLLLSIPATIKLAEYLQYRVIGKWDVNNSHYVQKTNGCKNN